MAGLGAMTISLIGGGIAWLCMVTVRCLITAAVFIDAYIHKMKVGLWTILTLFFGFYSLPFYIYARIKTVTFRCESCGEKVGQKKNFCPVCGTEVPKFDDGAFAKKSIKWIILLVIVFIIFSGIYTLVKDVIM